MTVIQLIICLLFCFFLPNVLYLILGLIFANSLRFHKFGIRCLAICMLVPGRYISYRCHMNCKTTDCRNWTCENYHHSKSNSPTPRKQNNKTNYVRG